MATEDDAPVVRLDRWAGPTDLGDGYDDLRSDVVAYGHVDPLLTLQGLADATGIPVGVLARYALARWAAGGSEGVLELGVSGVDHLARIIEQAEADGSDIARLAAFQAVRDIVGWLRSGLEGPGPAGR